MSDAPSLEMLLHPRIREHAWPVYCDRHWASAARAAFVVVERSLAEKHPGLAELFGRGLIERAFQGEPRLRLPERLDSKAQAHVGKLFESMFGYYRNYCAHKGEKVNATMAGRILVAASELLDLVDASERSYSLSGGVSGLIKEGVFDSEEQFLELLGLLDGYVATDDTWDGLFEAMGSLGLSHDQMVCMFELDLVHIDTQSYSAPPNEELKWYDPKTLSEIRLTDQGRALMAEKVDPED